jgi:coenzyme F420-reducing hydrogenase beta subunit
VRLLCAQDAVLAERVAFTLGLFCGHMKSARMMESFAWQMGVDLRDAEAMDYRLKDASRPANWYTAWFRLKDGSDRRRDWWNLADGDWGAGFFQNPACDACDDVIAETADIALGDAWVEPYSSDGRGTNVVVVRSAVLQAMVEEAFAVGRLSLSPVDAEFVVRTQAAGFRHRREGLAWRLERWPRRIMPRKRVAPGAAGLPLRRRLVYWMRRWIAAWSHPIFLAARKLDRPWLYLGWARASLAVYRGLAWSHGRIGAAFDRLLKRPA